MLTRYEPWGALRQLQDEMNRAFGEPRAARVASAAWAPAVDVEEQDERFVIRADVPGVEPSGIDVTMDKGVLTIRGERAREPADEERRRYRRAERVHGSFERSFSLPEAADAQRIEASVRHGVLEVVIAKKAAVLPKRIEVAH